MAAGFKLFGKGELPDEIKGELRTMLLQMRQERNAFESAMENAAATVEAAQSLTGPMAEAQQTFAALGPQIQAAQALAPQIRAVEDSAAALEQAQREAERELRDTTDAAGGLRRELEDLRALVDQALPLKQQIAEFMDLASPFQAIQEDAERMRSQMDGLLESFGRLSEAHARNAESAENTEARLGTIEERTNAVAEQFEALDNRTAALQEMSGALEHLTKGLPEVRRDLVTLEALADHVKQRLGVLDEQRETVERATAQAEHLSDLIRRLDRQTQRQRENAQTVAKLRDEVASLGAVHATLMERTDAVAAEQHEIDERHGEQRRELEAMRDEIAKGVNDTVARFEFERDGMDAVRQQVADLRQSVEAFEEKHQALDSTRHAIEAVESRAEGLEERMAALGNEMRQAEADVEHAQRVHAEVDRVSRIAGELAQRIDLLEAPTTEALDAAERRISRMEQRLEGIQARAELMDSVAERAAAIGRELDSRQVAMEAAVARLDEAAKSRDTVDQIVSDLNTRTETLTGALSQAEARVTEVRGIMDELDRRTPEFGIVREQLARFEQRFHDWRNMEETVNRALGEVTGRQTNLEQVKQEILRMQKTASEVMDTVRSVVSLRAEMTDHRQALDSVVRQLREVTGETETLEERRRQVAEIEDRLVRADAALIDVRHGMETIQSQRAFLDQVIETAGALRFQAKQAEALIETLREESSGRQ